MQGLYALVVVSHAPRCVNGGADIWHREFWALKAIAVVLNTQPPLKPAQMKLP